MTNEREKRLAEALQGILDIGKRDMTNPKYDGFFQSAREALALPAAEAEAVTSNVPAEYGRSKSMDKRLEAQGKPRPQPPSETSDRERARRWLRQFRYDDLQTESLAAEFAAVRAGQTRLMAEDVRNADFYTRLTWDLSSDLAEPVSQRAKIAEKTLI